MGVNSSCFVKDGTDALAVAGVQGWAIAMSAASGWTALPFSHGDAGMFQVHRRGLSSASRQQMPCNALMQAQARLVLPPIVAHATMLLQLRRLRADSPNPG